jgi:uncharacterized membrane protein YdbT with pleckstrin-like domain
MFPLHPQFIVDENQTRKAVILPIEEWEKLLDLLEELEDIRDYDAAKAGPQDAIPFEQAVREIEEGNLS